VHRVRLDTRRMQGAELMSPRDPATARPAASEERMAVRTPEHVQLNFLVAGAGNRFLAVAADLLLQALVLIGVLALLLFVEWATGGAVRRVIGDLFQKKEAGIWLFAGIILIVFLVQWGYFTFFETIWTGQTPGKRLLKIRVLREDGRPIGFTEAAIRNLIRTVLDSQPFNSYAVGFLTGILNDRFKRLGDFAAGTIVIRERRQRAPRPTRRPRTAVALTSPRVRPLTPDEAATLHAYLRRRDELDPATRTDMARRIAISLKQRLDVRQPGGMSFDTFLEWLDEESRRAQGLR
jgi:uncharacterized RDD family membrane protein YckC